MDKDKLPFSNREYAKWLETLPEEKAKEANGKLEYMRYTFGWESIRDIVAEDVYLYDKLETASTETNILVGSFDDTKPMEIPEGCTRFIGDGLQKTFYFSPEECRTGTLSIPLDKWVENAGDSILLDFKTLEEWDEENGSDKIPPVRIDSKSGKYVFYITYFWYNPRRDEDSSLQLNGYLFMK